MKHEIKEMISPSSGRSVSLKMMRAAFMHINGRVPLRQALTCLPVIVALVSANSPVADAVSPPATESETGMVVSAERLASEAGAAILRQGGNAIDAAVAVGYAEAVVDPCCGNIGGGGFMTAHLADGRDIFLNFRETAPAAASQDMYLDPSGQPVHGASLYGWKAVAVPGTVLGLDTALTKYGTLPRATVMAPAIRLARDGFELPSFDADLLAKQAPLLRNDPTAARLFLRPDGSPYQTGDRFRQTELAVTLQAIAEQGPDAFYKGKIPLAVETASRAGGGMINAADFASYRVKETAPLRCTYRGDTIVSAPPPSSGGVTMCEILNILEAFNLREMGFHSAEEVHLMVEAMRLAFFDRSTYLGDPDFVTVPLNRLLSKEYATRLRGQITDRAMPSSELGPAELAGPEKPETTHYSIIDKDRNAVAVTYTINGAFGAGVAAGDTGFLLNDEMDDFTVKAGAPNLFGLVHGQANAIAAGKRPLSSMAPTIVLRDGQVGMIIGSPGGPRIVTTVLETILNTIDHGMAPQEAVDAPRLHHQWKPDLLYAERFALSADTKALLTQMGYRIEQPPPWGAAALITVEPPRLSGTDAPPASSPTAVAASGSSVFYGANDPRRPSGAAIAP